MKRFGHDQERQELPERGEGLAAAITRFWLTTLVIAAILYAAVLVISRSDGFRDIVSQRLGMIAGIPVEVVETRADAWLNLQLHGITGGVTNQGAAPVVTVGEATLSWRWIPLIRGEGWPFRQLDLKDVQLRMTLTTNGVWQPFPQLHDLLAPWMKLSSPTNSQTLPEGITEAMRRNRVRVTVEQGLVHWVSGLPDEPPLAVAEGVQFTSSIVQPFGEDAMWCRMAIDRAETREVEWLRQVTLEWIRTPEKDVVITRQGEILDERQRLWQQQILESP